MRAGRRQSREEASLDQLGCGLFLLIAVVVTVLIAGLAGGFLVAECGIAWAPCTANPP
ncbi:hypothetical protein ACFVXE_32320 [Streptomyces sp. NPDC058231]|uniref:hypothetical protein n=1 Tax=Streptomyces sp. NPDC058231 TaxID=3346392 RepID=UPI0036E4C38D